jgi:hypothetical protein
MGEVLHGSATMTEAFVRRTDARLARLAPVCGSIICCSVQHWRNVALPPASTVRCAAANTRAIMHRRGSNWRKLRRHRQTEAGVRKGRA